MQKIFRLIAVLAACALLVCSAPALAVQADTVTRQCAFEVTSGREKYINDGDIDTAWSPEGENAKLLVTLPANGAGYLVVEWKEQPTGYIFAQYDENKEILVSAGETEVPPGLVQVYELRDDARYVLLTLVDRGKSVAEITAYSAGDLPASVQRWYGQYTKCDMMLVCAYPGDEFYTFGGLLPRYAVEKDAKVQVVYMTEADRQRMSESLSALWSLGLSNYPEFLGLDGSRVSSAEDCLKKWGGKDELIELMVECIRRFKPEVIVSHDINGEGGDVRRQLTGMLMEYAVTAAADPDAYPESETEYGTWQTKKLYLHLGDGPYTTHDWNEPAEALPGGNALEAARAAFECYPSLAEDFVIGTGGEQDTARYSLIHSTLGADARRNDFFENVPSLDKYDDPDAGATPEPTPVPSKTPALVFSPEPTEEITEGKSSPEDFGENMGRALMFVGICLGLILLLTCLQALIYRFRGRRRRRRR